MDDIRLLYVEDEADIREVAAFALEDEGFELLFCVDGHQALEKATEFQPDMILLDVMMPGMDGPTTLLGLRKIARLKDVPVVFLTAKVQPDEIKELLKLGAIDVIAKPFDPMTLAGQIRFLWEKCHKR